MITASQQDDIAENAYVPEHMTHYVTAVSQAEPFLLGDFLAYIIKDHLIFIGYPIREDFDGERMKTALDDATSRFKPREVALVAPAVPHAWSGSRRLPSDVYYRLDLSSASTPQKVRNMIIRADRELSVEKVNLFREEHMHLVAEFVSFHPLDEATQRIFKRIPEYISSGRTTWVFEARNKNRELVALDVAEFGAKHYAFYMFNFTSRARFVPGASDLLLAELIQHAKSEKKRYINLGLGINPGITFFKKKWGGVSFLPYTFYAYAPSNVRALEALFQKL